MAYDEVSESEENTPKSHLPSQIISQQIPPLENEDGGAVPIRIGVQGQLTWDKVHEIMTIGINNLLWKTFHGVKYSKSCIQQKM
uniref:Uncharacterized protein n=1 Tax=Romanomermis culicivorax TaxID=13658 RepID=A0A915KHW6_ROMCU